MENVIYPQIIEAGNLTNAINRMFVDIETPLQVSVNESSDGLPFAYARVENGTKFSQVYMAAHKILYLTDFWKDGVCLGNGEFEDLKILAECLNYWLTPETKVSQLSKKFVSIPINKRAIAFEEGNEVDYTWRTILNDTNRQEIRSFVELALKDNVLSKLFPYTSMSTLCFSKCTGYPYTDDTPTVSPTSDGSYIVRRSDNTEIGIGNAEHALVLVKDNLPKDIEPARKGTSDTFNY